MVRWKFYLYLMKASMLKRILFLKIATSLKGLLVLVNYILLYFFKQKKSSITFLIEIED